MIRYFFGILIGFGIGSIFMLSIAIQRLSYLDVLMPIIERQNYIGGCLQFAPTAKQCHDKADKYFINNEEFWRKEF